MDWEALFIPSQSLLEMFVRGTVVYLVLFLAFRFLPRRTIGAMGPSDLLVIVLIADAVQGGLAGDSHSVTEALVVAFTVFGWATLIDWLDFKLPDWHIAEASPLLVISNGELVHKNLRKQNITEDEVMAQLRQHGQDSPKAVQKAYVEGDGHFSVVLRSRKPIHTPHEKQQF